MDNFTPVLTFIAVLLVGIMVENLRRQLMEIRKLLEEVLMQSRKENNNQDTLSKE